MRPAASASVLTTLPCLSVSVLISVSTSRLLPRSQATATPSTTKTTTAVLMEPPRLDDGLVGDHAVLGNDHDPVPDVPAFPVAVLAARLGPDAHVAPDPRVLVDDGPL